ncbi:MAG: glycosyltransferase family 39 protein, partial [bacterium]|nr:glycosyltransferase family 39 protein [bacterium]
MRPILTFFCKIYDNKKALATSIVLGSILCSAVFLIFLKNIGPVEHGVPGTDYFDRYEPIANNILHGKGVMYRGEVLAYTAPGFPIILAGIFGLSQITGIDRLDLIVVFNIIFTAFSALFLFLSAREIFNKKIALIASLLWMTYPFNLWFIKNPNTEVPFILLLYLGIFLYLLAFRKKGLKITFLAGFFLGLASFIRITGLFLPFFLGLVFLFFLRNGSKKRRLLLVTILLIGNFAAIFPWMIYSISKTGNFLSISSEGPYSIVAGITWLSTIKAGGDQLVLPDDVNSLIERVKVADLSSGVKLVQFFGKELTNGPIPLLKLIGLKLGRSWYATSQQWWEDKILLVQSIYLITGIGGIIYGMRIYKDRIRSIILLLSIVFYFWGMTFLNISLLRYTIPAMGLVIIFSAVF